MRSLVALVASGLTVGYLLFVPPAHAFLVGFGILLIGISVNRIIAIWFSKKYQVVGLIGIWLFLGINYFVGFELVNTILLLSFIIGIILLWR